MFRLAKIGFLPSIFLDLKDDVPLCESCMFGTARRRKSIKKCKKSRSISKETENNLGDRVSVYQLHSYQLGLFSKLSGKLTSEHIWFAQVMVDHFSELTYVNLTIRTSQKETLSGKQAFERWAATFGANIKIYHADNKIFSEQPFRSAIEYANQTITICGVGSHNKNAIVERKIQP